eukprot:5230743-Amphidinium_carterae.1
MRRIHHPMQATWWHNQSRSSARLRAANDESNGCSCMRAPKSGTLSFPEWFWLRANQQKCNCNKVGLVEHTINGGASCILAYGATGSGKTCPVVALRSISDIGVMCKNGIESEQK